MNRSKFFKNIITGFGGQFVAIVLGLIVPRLFIISYGSDLNGLLSTITQVFTYMALLEAGIGQSAKNLLYKPFQEKDYDSISEIASIAKTYFRKCTIIYAIGVCVLALVLPYLFKTSVSTPTIILIVLLEGLSGVFSFYFIQTPSIIIAADGKSYVNNDITLLNKIIGYAVKIVMASMGVDIVLLQLTYFLITICKVVIYTQYFKKHYKWIRYRKVQGNKKLKDKNAYVLTEICWTIFSSTDMIVLSVFLSTQLSSVYSVYNMVFTNISMLLNSVYVSIVYILGYAYHESLEKYEHIHDAFNSIFIGVMTVLMSVCYILIIPFVKLYTNGVTDVNYVYESLPLMFCLIQLISWSRYIGGQLTGIAGFAKETSYISLIEAIINLTLSIVLVSKFGIVGVTLATVIALPIKVVWCTYIADKKVLNRSYRKSISIMGINYSFFFVIVILSKFYQPSINSYGQFFIWGIVLSIIFCVVGMTLNFLVNRDCWHVIRRHILKR